MGQATPCQHKVAFLKYSSTFFTAAAPAQSQAAIEAARNGKPFFTAITTTPSNLDSENGIYCKAQIMDRACPFDEAMYDWDHKHLTAYLDRNSENDFVYIKFTYAELGRSEAWFRQQQRSLNQDTLKIKREILLEWTKASDVSPFTEDQLDAIDTHVTEEVGTITLRSYYTMHLFDLPRKDKVYLVGLDVAGGLDQDESSLVIVDPETSMPMGYFANSKIDTDELFHVACDLLENFLPKSCLIVERNSYGLTICDRIMKIPRLERNLFFHDRKKEAERKIGAAIPKRTKVYGIDTTQKSRDLMIDILKKDVVEHPEFFRIRKMYDQVRNLERGRNGKIEHSNHSHDDVLFAYLLCRYAMWYHMKILNAFFLRKDADKSRTSHNEVVLANQRISVEATEVSHAARAAQAQLSSGKLIKKSTLMNVLELNRKEADFADPRRF